MQWRLIRQWAAALVIAGGLGAALGCDGAPGPEEKASAAATSGDEQGRESHKNDEREESTMAMPSLQTFGAMRQVNLHDDYSSAITFEEVKAQETALNHGVGALGELSGELTLWDDQIYVARAGEAVEFEQMGLAEMDDAQGATLLFGSAVEQWEAIDDIDGSDWQSLESSLSPWRDDQALSGPIAFRIRDESAQVHWHVVDASRIPEEGAASCEERKQYGHQFDTIGEPVRLVGIYTTDHTGVVVDHRTSMHIHVITDDGRTGHVDSLELSASAVLEVGLAPG